MDYTKYEHKLPYVLRSKNQDAYYAYNAEERHLVEMFKQDLFNDLGIADNPKREKLFSIAWENGHGYSEVYNEAIDLVDLIV